MSGDDNNEQASYGSLKDCGVKLDIAEDKKTSEGSNEGGDIDVPVEDDEAVRLEKKKSVCFDRSIHELARSYSKPHDEVDEERVAEAVREAGLYSFGVVAVEVRIYDEMEGRLVRPDGGWWRSNILPTSEALARLEDCSHPLYVKPSPLVPGEGLVGYLWTQTSKNRQAMDKVSNQPRPPASGGDNNWKEKTTLISRKSDPRLLFEGFKHSKFSWKSIADFGKSTRSFTVNRSRINWTSINSLSCDPFQPSSQTLELIKEAGFGLAAGVRFDDKLIKGIVVYYAREGVEMSKLTDPINEQYLQCSADYICAAASLTKVRRASIVAKRNHSRKHWRGGTTKFRATMAFQKPGTDNFQERGGDGDNVEFQSALSTLSCGFHRFIRKCRGGNLQRPRGSPPSICSWAFSGSFITLIILSRISVFINHHTNGNRSLLIAPFAAFMTLQYAFTAAPAAQPRDAVIGNIIAGAVGLSMKILRKSVVPDWVKIALAPATAISVMMRLGVAHPPSGAFALVFSLDSSDWVDVLIVLFGSILSIITAVIINNMNEERQYPTYWDLHIL